MRFNRTHGDTKVTAPYTDAETETAHAETDTVKAENATICVSQTRALHGDTAP